MEIYVAIDVTRWLCVASRTKVGIRSKTGLSLYMIEDALDGGDMARNWYIFSGVDLDMGGWVGNADNFKKG